ncbi:MAG: UDP-N-acetylmuramoyl-L-alanine--D-glutamate ligase [bacterium]
MRKGREKSKKAPETCAAIESLPGRNVLIVGCAVTGLAAIRFLTERGCRVTVSESKQRSECEGALRNLDTRDVQWEFGGHQEKTFVDQDLILVSPGVPMNIPPLVKASAQGIPVVSDIELAFQLTATPMIAITGTNGKTTTTTLVGEILHADNKKAFVGGNIGTPILDSIHEGNEYDYLVAEVSSFQLEGVSTFAPHIAVILNLTPDHLDRYPGIAAYQEAKARILRHQAAGDYAILNGGDPWVAGLAKGCAAKVYLFDTCRPVTRGAMIGEGRMIVRDNDSELDLGPVQGMGLTGSHNLENMMAASLAAYCAGVSVESIRQVLRDFKGLSHRLETVGNIGGITFINDSKGTNVGSVQKALDAVPAPILLIAGGQAKGCDFTSLAPLVKDKVRAVFLIGEAQAAIAQAWGTSTRIVAAADLRSAVEDAYKMAQPGDTILLSPGCASFDMFKDYKDRGNQFKTIVMELAHAQKTLL